MPPAKWVGRITQELLQSALDAQQEELEALEEERLETWYQELNSILDDTVKLQHGINRLRLRINSRITELDIPESKE